MKRLIAKYNGKCADTGASIKRGEACVYNADTKKVYSLSSPTAKAFLEIEEKECQSTSDYVSAQEEAYFQHHNID